MFPHPSNNRYENVLFIFISSYRPCVSPLETGNWVLGSDQGVCSESLIINSIELTEKYFVNILWHKEFWKGVTEYINND